MLPYFSQWNTVLFILGLASILALTIFIERLLNYKKSEVDTNRFIIELRKAIEEQNIVEAHKICEDTGGTLAQIIKAGLHKHGKGKEEIMTGMEIAGRFEIAKLEKNTKVLSIIAHVAPLIGLLGTVLGFIQAFSEMRQSGLMDISTTRVGQAMEYALVTTAAGLVVAIPSILGYNYLVSRIKAIVLEVEITAAQIVDLLTPLKDPYEV